MTKNPDDFDNAFGDGYEDEEPFGAEGSADGPGGFDPEIPDEELDDPDDLDGLEELSSLDIDFSDLEEATDTDESGPGVDPSDLMFIVVGAHLRAEVADRPLAYRLREAITAWIDLHMGEMTDLFEPVVCTDIWYVNHASMQRRPTVSLGGPGVNALSAYLADKLEPALVEDKKLIVQLDPEFVDLRANVWGMDHDYTVRAVDMFIEQYLDGFLRAVCTQVEPKAD